MKTKSNSKSNNDRVFVLLKVDYNYTVFVDEHDSNNAKKKQ